jgi:hypothetical protein
MLTKLIITNFKKFDRVEIELGNPVIFIGPNNSGKTSALQALTLWYVGLRKWMEKRKGEKSPEKRPGVTINRRDLTAVPVPNANLFWRNLHVREAERKSGKTSTKNIRIDVTVEGINESTNKAWKCGLEFDYANVESFYCRPLRLTEEKSPKRMSIPEEDVKDIQLAYLPPMSGLAATETRLDTGAVNVRIGEGRTAEVLRNLCHRIFQENDEKWEILCNRINDLFGARLKEPVYVAERGEIELSYMEGDATLDISSSGRGLQQTLLVLAYMYANKGAVLLIDEPDAHLEILRQRHIYSLLTNMARENGNQIIAASHSEVILSEAAERDVVVAFIGKPHRLDNRGSQVLKSLKDIEWVDYFLAEQTGWILYLEGSTDLAILQAFAEKLSNPEAVKCLERPFVKYIGNLYWKINEHFRGIREAIPHFRGIAIIDRPERSLSEISDVKVCIWQKREIENYLCQRETLERYARELALSRADGPLLEGMEVNESLKAMNEAIEKVSNSMSILGKGSPWDSDTKVSDDFLVHLFREFFNKLSRFNIMDKKNFHELVNFVDEDLIDPEVKEKLDAIVSVATPKVRKKFTRGAKRG